LKKERGTKKMDIVQVSRKLAYKDPWITGLNCRDSQEAKGRRSRS